MYILSVNNAHLKTILSIQNNHAIIRVFIAFCSTPSNFEISTSKPKRQSRPEQTQEDKIEDRGYQKALSDILENLNYNAMTNTNESIENKSDIRNFMPNRRPPSPPAANGIREVSNDECFSEPEHYDQDFDLNEDSLVLLTQQLCVTSLDEDQEVEYNTHLSQEDIYESNDAQIRLAQSDHDDDDSDDDEYDDDSTKGNGINFMNLHNNERNKAKRQKRNAQFQDTEDKYFQNGRVFKKHETFKHPTKHNFFYKIEKLFTRSMEKMATCTVFRKRSDTLLGDYLKDIEFVKYNHPFDVPLKQLGEWTTKPAPVTKLYYDDSNKLSRSHGFNVVFLIAKDNKTFLTEEQLERIKKNKQEARGRAKKRLSQSQKMGDTHPLINKIKDEPYRPTCFEAFAGCGGMTIGFTNAGFDVKWAVDINHAAAHSHERYHDKCRMFNEDIVIFMKNFERGLKEGDPEYEGIHPDHVHGYVKSIASL